MSVPLRIVIADDEPRMREFLCVALEQLGHQVVGAAKTGAELVATCRTMQPDLVMTDIRMAEMDGFLIPENLAYAGLASLSTEAREKLALVRPASLGQASRVPGVSPSDIQNLVAEVVRAREAI